MPPRMPGGPSCRHVRAPLGRVLASRHRSHRPPNLLRTALIELSRLRHCCPDSPRGDPGTDGVRRFCAGTHHPTRPGCWTSRVASARSTPLPGWRARLRRGRRTRHRTHATLPEETVGAYGREMRRPSTTRCLRSGLRARLVMSDVPQNDWLDAGPVEPVVAGGRRRRLGHGYAPPKGPHRAPTHHLPTDRRRAAVRAAPGERDGRPGTRWMPARSEPGA
jgi:hypothetical protein